MAFFFFWKMRLTVLTEVCYNCTIITSTVMEGELVKQADERYRRWNA